jgi:nucleoside-diphosphate-sugar epimerase
VVGVSENGISFRRKAGRTVTMDRIFIVGCGKVGRLIARRYLDQGRPVAALARSESAAGELESRGIPAVRGDLDDPASLTALSLDGYLIQYLAPPPGDGVLDTRMANLLAALGGRPRRIVYVSTSGVYGDCGGDWVGEDAPPNPQTDRARRRLDAENRLQDWGRQAGVAMIILRVGGIYGPGRLPEARLRGRAPILAEDQCGYTNRIHVEDLVSICLAAGESTRESRIYNVSDGRPGTMSGYFKAVARRLGLPQPEEIPMEEARERLSPELMSYLLESRRMDTRRLREELGVDLRYPDLDAGLRDV